MEWFNKLRLIILLLLCFNISYSNEKRVQIDENIIHAIAMVESKQDSTIVSKCGNFVGYLQISKVMVDECNRLLGYKKFTYNCRYSKQKSIEMFYIIKKHYNKENNVEKAIRMWKGGIHFTQESTNKYYQAVIYHLSQNRLFSDKNP